VPLCGTPPTPTARSAYQQAVATGDVDGCLPRKPFPQTVAANQPILPDRSGPTARQSPRWIAPTLTDQRNRGIGQELDLTLDTISTPDVVETSIGTLEFLDGAPLPATADKVYDYLDTMRGVDAFLKGIPGASVHGLIKGAREMGAAEYNQVLIFDELMDSRSLFLTGNTSTLYVLPDFDLEDAVALARS